MKKALYFEKLESGVVKCKLCPHYCMIGEEDHGICNVRINHKGVLYNELFEKVASFGFDPIEKNRSIIFIPVQRFFLLAPWDVTSNVRFVTITVYRKCRPMSLNIQNYIPLRVL